MTIPQSFVFYEEGAVQHGHVHTDIVRLGYFFFISLKKLLCSFPSPNYSNETQVYVTLGTSLQFGF